MKALKKGMRVRHTSRPEWGVGQVLVDANDQDVRVFFEEGGEKTFGSGAFGKLCLVSGAEANSSLLDNLALPGLGKSQPMATMNQAKVRFLELFPGGLHGKRAQEEEREYKDKLAELARSLYAPDQLQKTLHARRYDDIVHLAGQLIKAPGNNFPASFEKMKFADAMKTCARKEAFARAFCGWVLPAQPKEEAFKPLASELVSMGIAKWPIMTSWRFLLHPQTDALIKPENLQKAAKLSCFEINYKPDLNWLTYWSVLQFYEHVRGQISELAPKDMIDVQNFIWCIDQDQYPA